MSDQHSGQHGPQPEEQPDGAFPERELDEALSQAAALAEDLSRDVGTPEATESLSELGDNSLPRGAKPRIEHIDLDRELAGLEQTVDGLAGEVGSPSVAAEPRRASVAKTAPAVPDFMSEFTRPADPQASPPKPPGPQPAPRADTSPDRDKNANRPPVSDAATRPAKVLSPTAAGTSVEHSPSGGTSVASKTGVVSSLGADLMGAAPGVVGNIGEPLSKISGKAFGSPGPEVIKQAAVDQPLQSAGIFLRLADRGVSLLEMMNRPFEWVSPQAKHFLGWVAIATMATSIIVLAAAITANW